MNTDSLKILITAPFHAESLAQLQKKYQVNYQPDLEKTAIAELIGDYQILVITTLPEIDAELLKKAKKLKMIIRMGIGVDHIDLNYCLKNHIKVHITPRANILPVVELVFSQLIQVMRRLEDAKNQLKAGKFRKGLIPGSILSDKTLGVIGTGRIGSSVCQLARFFQMNVLAYDPYLSATRRKKIPVTKWVDLSSLIKESDIITLHVPLTAETYHMVDTTFLHNMKEASILINTARGKIIETETLGTFIKKRQDIRFIFDVYENEPQIPAYLTENSQIFTLTPHIGAYSIEAKQKRSAECVEQITAYANGKKVQGRIDLKRGY